MILCMISVFIVHCRLRHTLNKPMHPKDSLRQFGPMTSPVVDGGDDVVDGIVVVVTRFGLMGPKRNYSTERRLMS